MKHLLHLKIFWATFFWQHIGGDLKLCWGQYHEDTMRSESGNICFHYPMRVTSLHSNQEPFDIPIQWSKIRQIADVVRKPSLYWLWQTWFESQSSILSKLNMSRIKYHSDSKNKERIVLYALFYAHKDVRAFNVLLKLRVSSFHDGRYPQNHLTREHVVIFYVSIIIKVTKTHTSNSIFNSKLRHLGSDLIPSRRAWSISKKSITVPK